MLDSDVINQLQHIAQECKASIELNIADDESYVDVSLRVKSIDIDVIATKIHGEYLAYGMESTGLPRELYMLDDSDELLRSREIISNVEKLLKRQIPFHAAPGALNKSKGYVVLSIDGKSTKVPQKSNFFKLPMSEIRPHDSD